ncbi:MAG TPA: hypothetical protein PLB38_00290 [bacterium]|nr:hypothetical protein [bacterium]
MKILQLMESNAAGGQKEKPDKKFQQKILTSTLKQLAETRNAEMKNLKNPELNNLLNTEGKIQMDNYQEIVYDAAAIEQDKKKIHEQELEFSGLQDEKILAFKKEEYRTTTLEDTLAKWKQSQNERPGAQAEMAITILLNHFLGDEFIVARSSDYDDYFHKTDQVLFHKTTGQAICSFDDLYSDRPDQKRALEKLNTSVKIAQRGGNQVKYGLQLHPETKQLRLGAIQNVPNFCLSIQPTEISAVVTWLKDKQSPDKTAVAQKIAEKLINLIITQSEYQLNLSGRDFVGHGAVRKNLENTVKLMTPYLAGK